MALVQDFILDNTYDLVIENGDFVIAPSDEQHINLLFKTTVGSWKQFPLVGIGIDYYQASAGQVDTLKRNINVQLTTDGYTITRLILQENDINTYEYYISADRNNS
jgi:hypothetical protein